MKKYTVALKNSTISTTVVVEAWTAAAALDEALASNLWAWSGKVLGDISSETRTLVKF